MDISLILTLHNEGRMVHRTMRSVERSVSMARSKGKTVEVVAILDCVTDKVLKDVLVHWQKKMQDCLITHEVEYAELGRSRNFGTRHSSGQFIAFLDGDDLISENWLCLAHDVCSSRGTAIARPELVYFFPDKRPLLHSTRNRIYWHPQDANLRELLGENLWVSVLLAERPAFEMFPYSAKEGGYAYQDWLWNCQTIAAGYVNVPVNGTLAGIRKKSATDSALQRTRSEGRVVPPNKLFKSILTSPFPTTISTGNEDEKRAEALRENRPTSGHSRSMRLKFAAMRTRFENFLLNGARRHLSARNRARIKATASITKRFCLELTSQIFVNRSLADQEETGNSSSPAKPQVVKRSSTESAAIPAWAHLELKNLAAIEPGIASDEPLDVWRPRSRLHEYVSPGMKDLVQTPGARLFIMSYISRGGAHLEALHYMHALGGPVFVVTTQKAANPWRNRLPENSCHIDIGNIPLSYRERMTLLHRLLLESDLDFLHIVNSPLAYDMLLQWPKTFDGVRIFCSLFCNDVSKAGNRVGFAINYYPHLIDLIFRVAVDNRKFKEWLEEVYAISRDQITVHRQPFNPPHFPMALNRPSHASGSPKAINNPLRVLFAGRLHRQKRPELAIQIVRELRGEGIEVEMDMWGARSSEYQHLIDYTGDGSGIRLRGGYDGLLSVLSEGYDVFLLPSAWEGLPNVVIEAMGNGMPVIAADVGGVGEIVNDETGWLIHDHNNVESYKRVFRQIIDNPDEICTKAEKSLQFVQAHHSWEQFREQALEMYYGREK
ncbi:MAG: glycosyltransferase [Thermodesulfobacteriota bacterium]